MNKRDPWTVQSTSKPETKHRSKTPRLHPTQRRSRSRGLREKVLEGGCTRPDIRDSWPWLEKPWRPWHFKLSFVSCCYCCFRLWIKTRNTVGCQGSCECFIFFFCKGFWADPQRSRALLWAGHQSVESFLNQMRSVFYLLRRFCRNIHNLGIKIIPLWNPVAQTISNNASFASYGCLRPAHAWE